MNQVTMKITGMRCGMCEAHICDTIRKVCPNAKSVSASHSKKSAQFRINGDVDSDRLTAAVNETGYTCESISVEPYVKKGFFHF